jgi:hypothetical protein
VKTRSLAEAVRHIPILHCEQIQAFFGPERLLTNILPVHVGKFYKSDELLRLLNGKDRALATVNKTRRVFKALMAYALDRGYIQALPLPKN